MTTNEQTDRFYSTGAWRKAREAYLDSVGRKCERCEAKGIIRPADHVHHKVRISWRNINDADITLNPANLEALCEECHRAEHNKTAQDKRWRVGADGKVTI